MGNKQESVVKSQPQTPFNESHCAFLSNEEQLAILVRDVLGHVWHQKWNIVSVTEVLITGLLGFCYHGSQTEITTHAIDKKTRTASEVIGRKYTRRCEAAHHDFGSAEVCLLKAKPIFCSAGQICQPRTMVPGDGNIRITVK